LTTGGALRLQGDGVQTDVELVKAVIGLDAKRDVAAAI